MAQYRATCIRKYWQKIEQHANISDNAEVAQSTSRSCHLRIGPPGTFEDDNVHFRNEQRSEMQDQNHTLRIVYENTFDIKLAAEALTQALWRFQETENLESFKAALITALRLNISISSLEQTRGYGFRFRPLFVIAKRFDEIVHGVRQVNDPVFLFGPTILHAACSAGFAELLEPLFWRGACFDPINKLAQTPLEAAIISDDIDTIRYALALGSDPNRNYPLFHAFTAERHDIATLLVKHGADIDQSWCGTILFTAVKDNDLGKVRLALSLGADPNGAHPMDVFAADCPSEKYHDSAHGEMACLLLEHGADVSRRSRKGCTIFHYAAIKAHSQLLSIALRRINSSMILDVGQFFNETPLHYATKASHAVPLHQVLMTTSMLLAAGADVNVQNSRGKSALMFAAMRGSDELVRLLLDAGANVTIKCRFGQTALSCAAEQGHGTTVELLLEKAPPTREDSAYLSSALERAIEGDHQDVVEQLQSFGADSSAENVLF